MPYIPAVSSRFGQICGECCLLSGYRALAVPAGAAYTLHRGFWNNRFLQPFLSGRAPPSGGFIVSTSGSESGVSQICQTFLAHDDFLRYFWLSNRLPLIQ
jgi:hypothetical protein